MAKKLLQVQAALFFTNSFNGKFEEISLSLQKSLGDAKKIDFTNISINAPDNIPRLLLKYDKFNINFSKNRFDIFAPNWETINTEIDKMLAIIKKLNLQVGRLGFIKTFFSEDAEYTKTLLKEDKIGNLDIKEINIRINVQAKFNGFDCNNIENFQPGNKEESGNKEKGVIIMRDINTLSEKLSSNNFNEATILSLFNYFDRETSKSIL